MWTASFIPGFLWDNGGKNIKKLSQFENRIEAQNYFMRLMNLTIDTYKWENLPDTCDERFLEMMLLINGYACMRKGEAGLMTLGFMPAQWNIYGQPATGTSFGFFGQAEKMSCFTKGGVGDFDGVVCRCNTLNYPIVNYIRVVANRLADTIRSMDVIRKQLKSPFIVSCAETQVPTAEKIFNKTQDNEIYIIGSNMLDREAFSVLPTGVQGQNIEILQQYFDNTLNDFLRLIGIKGASNTDKKERLIVAEATSDFAITNDYLDMGLHTRKEFADNCNELFGTDIVVTVNDSREYFTSDNLYPNFSMPQEEKESNEIS